MVVSPSILVQMQLAAIAAINTDQAIRMLILSHQVSRDIDLQLGKYVSVRNINVCHTGKRLLPRIADRRIYIPKVD